ncbi:hypothetical protein EVAR_103114_1 [Eumeta japonica]|uniref:Uncharacterized protein n=1 Tax=Eumeta variegata TaxID=151549 RepID=A0A4C1X5F7_EUMVA|nr:hypothetical protein EVAR_103114_1 [Eumeta japonica]
MRGIIENANQRKARTKRNLNSIKSAKPTPEAAPAGALAHVPRSGEGVKSHFECKSQRQLFMNKFTGEVFTGKVLSERSR